MYVFSMELLYFLLGMSIFVFTDATDDLTLKQVGAYACIVFVTMFAAATFFMSFYFAVKGRASLRASDKRRKVFRRQEVERRKSEKDRRDQKRKVKEERDKEKVRQARLR